MFFTLIASRMKKETASETIACGNNEANDNEKEAEERVGLAMSGVPAIHYSPRSHLLQASPPLPLPSTLFLARYDAIPT